MNCARVIGKTYSEFKHPALKGYDFKILQVVDAETGKLTGKPFFAIDPVGVALDEFVAYEEAVRTCPWSGSRGRVRLQPGGA